MERVAFLIEATGERIGCLLNPDNLVVRRQAGVRPRRAAGGMLTGARLADNPLIFTGGGSTELDVDLLFDVNVAGSSIATQDVRDLTRPLWNLAENVAGDEGYARPRVVRFVWGKTFNIPGIIVQVAERLEQFAASGVPQRSWMRLRLVRVSDPSELVSPAGPPPIAPGGLEGVDLENLPELGDDGIAQYYEVHGTEGGDEAGSSERIDVLSYRLLGTSDLWPLLASLNGIIDPLRLAAGTILRVPTVSALLSSLRDTPDEAP